MKLIFSALALLAVATASAQHNRISIGASRLGWQKSLYSDLPSGTTASGVDALEILPVIGYYRMFGKSTGVGLEVGYGRFDETAIEEGWGWGRSLTRQETQTAYQEFYLCPSVFETFSSQNGKYRFIASLNLPFSYSSRLTKESRYQSLDISESGSVSYEPDATLLTAGLFVTGSVQRRLAGGLYLAPQIGIGSVCSQLRRDGMRVSVYTSHGIPQNRSEISISETETNYRLEIRPLLALNYYF